MAQVYGCIQCGMLFAGWDFCLTHIEHCRPQHYLEVDKQTLKEMCMIGHRRCMVPSYQTAVTSGNYGNSAASSTEESKLDPDYGVSTSFSESECSNGETTLTQDFLNPVEKNLRHIANIVLFEDDEKRREYHREHNRSKETVPHNQEQNVVQASDSLLNKSRTQSRSFVKFHQKFKKNESSRMKAALSEDDVVVKSMTPITPKISNTNESLKKALSLIEKRLHKLIQESSSIAQDGPKMLLLEVLPKVYEVQFGKKLDFEGLGFQDMRALICAIPTVTIVVRTPYYNIEHEYLQLTDPNRSSLRSWGEDESEESQHTGIEEHTEDIDDKYKPNFSKTWFPMLARKDSSLDSVVVQSYSNQITPVHANHGTKPFSFKGEERETSRSSNESSSQQLVSAQSNTGSSTASTTKSTSHPENESDESENQSIASSTSLSSFGSSKSVISALADMLPSTKAYTSLNRVLAKHPEGITIGKLMLKAPDFKNFLSHCTDRRCEAQIKLAHSVLQQCRGIGFMQAPDNSILYYQAPLNPTPKSFSTDSKTSNSGEESAAGICAASTSMDNKAANLEAELATPHHALSTRTGNHGSHERNVTPRARFKKPAKLDTISSPNPIYVSPATSPSHRARSISPMPRNNQPTTPQGTTTTKSARIESPSREQIIAESAARILAQAQSMTTPTKENNNNDSPIPGHREYTFEENVEHMLSIVQIESANVTPQKRNNVDHSSATRMYFFRDKSSAENPGLSFLDRGTSMTTTGTPSESSVGEAKNENDPRGNQSSNAKLGPNDHVLGGLSDTGELSVIKSATRSHALMGSREGGGLFAKSEVGKYVSKRAGQNTQDELFRTFPGDMPSMTTSYMPSVSNSEKRDDIVKTIARDLFQSTKMHYKLWLALAANPTGMTWEQIDSLIPELAPFVQKHGAARGVENLKPWEILQACFTISRKQEEGTYIYFLSGHNDLEDSSVASGMAKQDSSCGPTTLPGPSLLSLSFKGSDTEALLYFLGRIKADFQGRVWPASWGQAYQYLVQLEKECALATNDDQKMFGSWLNYFWEETPQKNKSNRKRSLAKLLDLLQRLRCIRRENGDLHWDQQHATDVIEIASLIKKSNQKQNHADHRTGEIPTSYIETIDQLNRTMRADPFCRVDNGSSKQRMVSVMCVGTVDQLNLVLVGTETLTYIFDCGKLDPRDICKALSPLLANETIIKSFQDVHSSAAALHRIGNLTAPWRGVFDTQLAVEALTGVPSMTLDQMLRQLGLNPISSLKIKNATSESSQAFGHRPLSKEVLSYAAESLDLQTRSARSLFAILHEGCKDKPEMWLTIRSASDARASRAVSNGGRRQVCFDKFNSYALASEELMQSGRPADIVKIMVPSPLSNAEDSLLDFCPEGTVKAARDGHLTGRLSCISLEPGRPATAWCEGRQVPLGRRVTGGDIATLVSKLDGGLEGGDDMEGLDGQLHRVCAVRNRKDHIVGLTLHIVRPVIGAANMILDLLFSDPSRSILFLGESGSGKTTFLRDVARLLSERMCVSIIDTYSEIAGCCDIAHSSVGEAKRVMVHRREDQCHDIIQCLRSERPNAIVVDELDSISDVTAADYCNRRSVRLMASAVGTMEDLLTDPSRSRLLGGVKDADPACLTRESEPIFDVVVELRRGVHCECRVIMDTADAVDATLSGKPFWGQVRTHDLATGSLLLTYEKMY